MTSLASPMDVEAPRVVIEPEGLERARVRPARARVPRARPDGSRRSDRLRRPRVTPPSLPIGWTDEQDGGTYRLRAPRRRGPLRLRRRAAFVEAVPVPGRGSGSGAPAATRTARTVVEEEPLDDDAARLHRCALLRAARDRDPGSGLHRRPHVDRDYAARREGAFLVAVNCFEPAATCFCASMGTGPEGSRPATTSR